MSPALRFLSHQTWAIHPPVFEALASLLEARANGQELDHTTASEQDGKERIQILGDTAVISVRGVIARYADQINGACQDQGRSAESLQRDLRAYAGDPRIKRLILRIDSPGGTVAGTAETADLIREISASGKKIIAFVDGLAASAGYWLASQADEIVLAGPTSEVGSIGVITAHVDATKAQDKAGYRVTVLRTSPLKAPGAMGESLTPDQIASIQRDLADFHRVFASAVQAGRGLTDEQIAKVTTGQLWRPDEAIALGLADAVATWEQVLGSTYTTTPPAALTATAQGESTMDIKLQAALTRLAAALPTLAAAIVAKAAEAGTTAEALEAYVKDLQAAEARRVLEAQISDLKAQVESITKAKADAEAALKAKADEVAKLQAQVDQAKAWKASLDKTGEVKADHQVENTPTADAIQTAWKADPVARACFGSIEHFAEAAAADPSILRKS
jgi:signal peptide peptidase SppA